MIGLISFKGTSYCFQFFEIGIILPWFRYSGREFVFKDFSIPLDIISSDYWSFSTIELKPSEPRALFG